MRGCVWDLINVLVPNIGGKHWLFKPRHPVAVLSSPVLCRAMRWLPTPVPVGQPEALVFLQLEGLCTQLLLTPAEILSPGCPVSPRHPGGEGGKGVNWWQWSMESDGRAQGASPFTLMLKKKNCTYAFCWVLVKAKYFCRSMDNWWARQMAWTCQLIGRQNSYPL